ncbi:hypothetical protein ACTFIR_011503 [Dictyostelium discoideum]
MKMKKIILTLLILLFILNLIRGDSSATTATKCNRDYECGNYPYAACNGGLNLGYGIVYNSNIDKLIVSGKYNSSDSGPFGYPYIFNLDTKSTNGSGSGEATIEIKNKIYGEILNNGGGFTTFYKIYQYAPIHNYLYITFYQSGSNIYAIYDQTTSSIKQVLNIWGVPFTVGFNKDESKTVYGEYGIFLINGIPSQKSDFSNSTLLYKNQITNAILLQDNDIYISTYDGKFYLGSTNCRDCSSDKLKLLFTDNSSTTNSGFFKINDMIYYSNENGIRAFSINNSSSSSSMPPIILTNDSISSMTTDGKNIYYIITGSTGSSFTNNAVVKSISILKGSGGGNSKPMVIYTPKSNNQCQCAVGFKGDKCETCDGKTLWNNGIPLCTPIDNETGYPKTCFTPQDCSNSQFVFCNGTCSCLPGFTQSKNDCICSNHGSVIWTNGYPTCFVDPN